MTIWVNSVAEGMLRQWLAVTTYRVRFVIRTTLVGIVVGGVLVAPIAVADEIINVYSARKESLILPLLEKFESESGIEVRLVTGKADALLKRIEIEGSATPADLFITVDAGRLHRAKEAGILQQITSQQVIDSVPHHLRDPENYWVGLSMRARPIFYAKATVDPSLLESYEELADERWRGRICIRSSSNIYNQSLVASMIESIGSEKTLAWSKALVNNMARPPAGGDTDQLKAVAAGECDIAVANTYYYGRLAASDDASKRSVVEKLGVFWPNQTDGDRGVHVNVSGAGIVAPSKNSDNATRLLKFLVTAGSQQWYAQVNQEYPIVPGIAISPELEAIGDFKADSVNMSVLGQRNAEAVETMDKAGWH